MQCNNNEVILYDSLFRELDENTSSAIYYLFNTRKVEVAKCQQQDRAVDWRLFSIAFATSIAHGIDPETVEYMQAHMRMHLVTCFHKVHLRCFHVSKQLL